MIKVVKLPIRYPNAVIKVTSSLSLYLPSLGHFLITFHDSSIVSVYFILFCPIIILFLPTHSQLLLSFFVLVFVLCVSSLLFYPLSTPYGDSLSFNPLFYFIFHCFSTAFPRPTFPHFPVVICCPSVGSSNAVSRADTMRRSTTVPTWGFNPRRRRSRQQNYKTKRFHSGLFSPPPLPPSGKNPHPQLLCSSTHCGVTAGVLYSMKYQHFLADYYCRSNTWDGG